MKISVQWRTESPSAAMVAGLVSKEINYPVMPEYDERYKRHGLSFECSSLSDTSDAGLKERSRNGIVLANRIVQWLWDNHQVYGERMVEGWDIGAHACLLERRVRHLEVAMGRAIAELKQTRSWLKDKRFAEIRRGLEEAMATPLH